MPWNPEQYHRFQQQRAEPFYDLITLITKRANITVVDLGCGTGELTAQLADMLPGSDVTGLDSSAEMLGRAARYARPSLRFVQGDIETFDQPADLIFSTAALHWIDDQPALIARLFALVRPGGQIAVQVPSNFRHPSHTLIIATAQEEPFRTALAGWARESPVLGIDQYAGLLYTLGGTDITVFEKVYGHILPDADAIADWTKGSTLVPYLERLPPDLHAAFEVSYRAKLRARYPESPTFYGFRRTLFAATKA
jgi:trans-aconitate 2-methyltransferase